MDEEKNIKQNNDSFDLEQCQKEREEYLNLAKRLKAEFINYKKDEEKRFERYKYFARTDLIVKILNVLDGFNQAVLAQTDLSDWARGILKIKDQLEDLIKKEGVSKIEVNPGDSFDPNFHESLDEVESGFEEGMIAEVLRTGYKIDSFVIRPAQVRISKKNNN